MLQSRGRDDGTSGGNEKGHLHKSEACFLLQDDEEETVR